jgi:hypothetical protein
MLFDLILVYGIMVFAKFIKNASSDDDLPKSGNEAAACTRIRISNVIHRNLGGAERQVHRLVIALVCRLSNAHTG